MYKLVLAKVGFPSRKKKYLKTVYLVYTVSRFTNNNFKCKSEKKAATTPVRFANAKVEKVIFHRHCTSNDIGSF